VGEGGFSKNVWIQVSTGDIYAAYLTFLLRKSRRCIHTMEPSKDLSTLDIRAARSARSSKYEP